MVERSGFAPLVFTTAKLSQPGNMNQSLESIYDLLPLDLGGRYSRRGFIYQDHVGASFCIEMLTSPSLTEIWFETHDDITLIWNTNGIKSVEFVQVKAIDLSSRWSIARIASRKNNKEGTSIVEKSIRQCRCKEKVSFRIITSIDVAEDLNILKYPIGSPLRKAQIHKEQRIINKLDSSLGGIRALDGTSLDCWVQNCLWDKKPDSIGSLESENKIALENALENLGKRIYPDLRDEIYQKLLALVSEASSCNIIENINCYRIKRMDLLRWLDNKESELKNPASGTEPLEDKLKEAGVSDATIRSAKELKWSYTSERLNPDFLKPSLKELESEILTALHIEKVKLDSGELVEDGLSFHSRCLRTVRNILRKSIFGGIPIPLAVGYMYELTNRCQLRYVRVKP